MPQRSEQQRIHKAIRLTCLAGSFIMIVMIIISLYIAIGLEGRSLPLGNMRMIFLVLLLLLAYALSNRVHYKIPSFIIMSAMLLSFMIYPLLPIDSRTIENIFLIVFLVCICTVISFLVYNIKTDRVWIFGWNTAFLLFSILSLYRNFNLIPDHELYEAVVEGPIIAFAFIMLTFLINLIIYNSRNYNYDKSAEMLKTNSVLEKKLIEIDHQNSELIAQKAELLSLQKEINRINSGLEEQVKKRTIRLQKQNDALKKYGFLSSRLIRYPIQKLNLTLEDNNDERLIQCEKELILEFNNTISDLENITIAIGDVLNNFDTDSIKHIESSIIKKYSKI